ncbi:hypothetical protein [Nostoc sp.]|uniref:hypothetical protein n=1 Tax=Nostoc sp. TaxID=1180 RepID=UPI002FFC1707
MKNVGLTQGKITVPESTTLEEFLKPPYSLTEKEIDTSDIPPLTKEFFSNCDIAIAN